MTLLTLIILALIDLEGGTNGDCVGPLGIKPIYVEDANTILGRQEFTLADRDSRVKSIRMARIVLGHYWAQHPEWGVKEVALLHKCGIRGMKTPTAEDLDYADRCGNLVEAATAQTAGTDE